MIAESDTIAAIATPLGAGGLGVIRLSGPHAVAIASSLFRSHTPLAHVPSHTLHHGVVHDESTDLDDGVAAVFRAPRSYTGEDVVELSCHGSVLLLKRVLETCLARGARLAGPGEFTRRAYTHGKMDLAQAEAVADLITARSDTLRRSGWAQLRGDLSRRLDTARSGLITLLASVEANLDFVDDEVPPLDRQKIDGALKAAREQIRLLRQNAERGRWARRGLRAVLVGRPNAGKSSLFNALLGEQRAIVTDRPGTTRDTLEETIVVGDVPVVLTDTAGLRVTRGVVEKEGVDRAHQSLSRADLVLWTADGSRTPHALLRPSFPPGAVVLLVLTRADRCAGDRRVNRTRAWARVLDIDPTNVFFVSPLTGEGIPALRDHLPRAVQPTDLGGHESRPDDLLINTRHDENLRNVVDALDRCLDPDTPEEVLCLELRRAVAALGDITGRAETTVSEEVLDAIFSQFCIGK